MYRTRVKMKCGVNNYSEKKILRRATFSFGITISDGVGSWKLEVGSWRLEVGSWRLEVGSWMLDVGGLMFDVRRLFEGLPGEVRC